MNPGYLKEAIMDKYELLGLITVIIVTVSNLIQFRHLIKKKRIYGVSTISTWIMMFAVFGRFIYYYHQTNGNWIYCATYLISTSIQATTLYFIYFPGKILDSER